MVSKRRNRQRRTSRSSSYREPKPRILVVTEGEVTEPEYLKGFEKAFRHSLIDVKYAKEHGLDPHSLVKIAKVHKEEAENQAEREGDRNLRYNSVWCVFDIDDHRTVSDAKQMARANNIELAISNPAIELWLLLHFQDSPGGQHRSMVSKMLKKHIPGYRKRVKFAQYEHGYDQAEQRAERLDEMANRDNEPHRNPSTGMYKLTRMIRVGQV